MNNLIKFFTEWDDRLRRILHRNEARFERLVVAMERIAEEDCAPPGPPSS